MEDNLCKQQQQQHITKEYHFTSTDFALCHFSFPPDLKRKQLLSILRTVQLKPLFLSGMSSVY